jgi:hypothetical protein
MTAKSEGRQLSALSIACGAIALAAGPVRAAVPKGAAARPRLRRAGFSTSEFESCHGGISDTKRGNFRWKRNRPVHD